MSDHTARGRATDQWQDYDAKKVPGAVPKSAAGEFATLSETRTTPVLRLDETKYRVSASKRIFDVIGALTIGISILPVFLVISVAIRATGSPVFFSHPRIGLGHRSFRCYKFRSMVPHAEERLQELLRTDERALREWRADHKLRDDPRITPFGKFLRSSSMDELPQLWNVLKGEMSLVGPRPIVADELERYGNKARDYCSVRPGMTGLWQVLGRNNVTYSRRVSMDVLYIRKQSLRVDCWVMWRTVIVVLKRIGAY